LKIDSLEKSVQQKDKQINQLENFAVDIATVQNRMIEKTMEEARVELLERDLWKTDEDEMKWREFIDRSTGDELHVSEFAPLLNQNKLYFDFSFENILEQMLSNIPYYGNGGEFYKINVPSFIDCLQVIYKRSLSEYFTKDPTMCLRSSHDLVSYSEGNCHYIVINEYLFSSLTTEQNKNYECFWD